MDVKLLYANLNIKGRKRMLKKVGALSAAATVAIASSGIAGSTTVAIAKTRDNSGITIGWSVYGLQAEFAVLLNNAVQAEAKKLGVKVITMDGQYDANTQNNQLQELIAQKVNAIILDPISATGQIPMVKLALKNHIPVIGVNTKEQTPETCYVGSDDVIAGQMEMTAMAKALHGKGNIVVLEGPIGQSATIGRNTGINMVLKKYPNIHVLSWQTANWQRNQALNLMQNWLTSYGKRLNGVVAENDDMAAGVIGALRGAGLAGKIPVVGIDGIIAGLQNVERGYQTATVFQDAYKQGQLAVDMAVKAAKGQKVPKNVTIPFIFVSKSEAPSYLAKRYQEEGIKK
ncbi:MAG: substrate-binding domain-containing protein [Alicyclobacillus sp.]|nr:substrate-binding domain-containing protein [Alicyclobacillus sp.]